MQESKLQTICQRRLTEEGWGVDEGFQEQLVIFFGNTMEYPWGTRGTSILRNAYDISISTPWRGQACYTIDIHRLITFSWLPWLRQSSYCQVCERMSNFWLPLKFQPDNRELRRMTVFNKQLVYKYIYIYYIHFTYILHILGHVPLPRLIPGGYPHFSWGKFRLWRSAQ